MKRAIERWFAERTAGYYQNVIATVLHFGLEQGAKIVDVAHRGSDRLWRFLAPAEVEQHAWFKAEELREAVRVNEHPSVVLGIDLVNYAEDIQAALERIAQIAGPSTAIVLSRINPLWTPFLRVASWIGLVQPRAYANWITRSQFEHFLHLSGLEVVRYEQALLFPVRIPLLSWFINTYLARLPGLRRLCLTELAFCRKLPEPKPTAPSVSVVIPARNERGNIEAALERMPRFAGELEVIFVEGHSSDGTWEKIQEVMKQADSYPFRLKAAQQAGKGKGDAVRKGFDLAENDIFMILDADLTVPPEDLPRFYEILAHGKAEYVHGTRLVYPMQGQAMRPLNWLGNKFFGYLLSYLLGQQLTDTLCGTKCLYRETYQRLAAGRAYFGEFDPFGDFDLIFGAAHLGVKMEEVPIRYRARTYGETQIHRFRDGLLLLRMCAFASRKLRFLPHILTRV